MISVANGGLSFGGDNELELELSFSQPSSHLEFFLLWVCVKYVDTRMRGPILAQIHFLLEERAVLVSQSVCNMSFCWSDRLIERIGLDMAENSQV